MSYRGDPGGMCDARPEAMREHVLVDPRDLSEMQKELEELRAKLADAFSAEEMDAIREQLAERAQAAEQAREETEWHVRVELARVREAESMCARAALEMREISASLARLLGEEDTVVTRARPTLTPVRKRMLA
jgi:hypothetical protein